MFFERRKRTRPFMIALALATALVLPHFTGCKSGGPPHNGGTAARQPLQREERGPAWPTACRDNRLTALSPHRGPGTLLEKWSVSTGARVQSWAVISREGKVLVGCQNKVMALNGSDGSTAWEFKTAAGAARSASVAEDGTVYACAGNIIHALTEEGRSIWSYNMGSTADYPVVAEDGTVYVGSTGGTLAALSGDGRLLWRFRASGCIHSPSIDREGNLYCGGSPLVLYAFDGSGRKVWELRPEGNLAPRRGAAGFADSLQSPSIDENGFLYAGSNIAQGAPVGRQGAGTGTYPERAKLYCVSPEGQKNWEYAPSRGTWAVMTPAIGRDGMLYAGTSVSRVIALRSDGSVEWVFNTGEAEALAYSPSIGADGLLYVALSGAKLICVNSDGTERRRFDVGAGSLFDKHTNDFTPPAIGADGVIYTTLYQGGVYALH